MNKFVFVTPMYNASETLSQMLMSIAAQSYKEWEVILIDDMSSEEHVKKCIRIIGDFNDFLGGSKIKVHWNDWNGRGKQFETSNVLFGIKQRSEDDIICRIDGDDYLTDNDALSILDIFYRRGADAVWTMHRWNISDRNISSQLPANADPYKHPWVSSHFKTFRKSLITGIDKANFLNMDGEPVKRCGDQAIYLPVLHRAKCRAFIPIVTYNYRIDEKGGAVYQTDDAKFQLAEANFIRQRGFVEGNNPWEDFF